MRAPRLIAAIAAAAALLAGCGGDTSEGPSGDVGPALAAPINLADCTDWNNATPDERLGTIDQIHNYVGGPAPGTGTGTGAVLDEDTAYDLFERACEPEYARGFRLYKLYSRAAAFGGG
jgi:predicted small secreted protein